MPLYIEDNEFLMEVLRKGEARGMVRGEVRGRAILLRRILAHKFGNLPRWADEKLAAANSETLELWALEIFDAKELTQVFNGPPLI